MLLLVLMVIRLVAHGDLLLPDLPPELAIHCDPHPGHGMWVLLLEDAAHVVEERDGGGEESAIDTVQKKFGVLVALLGG